MIKNFNSNQIINYTSNIVIINKSWKQFIQIKSKVRQILYLLYQHNKFTKKFTTIQSSHYNYVRKYDGDKRSQKFFCFNFDWPKYVHENLKHEIQFLLKSNKPLTENKIKNETGQLLLKYKHGKHIHEHGKQQNEQIT